MKNYRDIQVEVQKVINELNNYDEKTKNLRSPVRNQMVDRLKVLIDEYIYNVGRYGRA